MICRVIASSFAVVLLSSCLSSDPASLNVKWPDVYGPSAHQLARSDIWQIVELARHQPNVVLPVTQIEAYEPARARVRSGDPQESGQPLSEFEAEKHGGTWIIKKGSVSTGRAIITS